MLRDHSIHAPSLIFPKSTDRQFKTKPLREQGFRLGTRLCRGGFRDYGQVFRPGVLALRAFEAVLSDLSLRFTGPHKFSDSPDDRPD